MNIDEYTTAQYGKESRKKSSSTSGPTTKALTPHPLSFTVILFFETFFRASKKVLFLSGPAFTPPPPPLSGRITNGGTFLRLP